MDLAQISSKPIDVHNQIWQHFSALILFRDIFASQNVIHSKETNSLSINVPTYLLDLLKASISICSIYPYWG
jgi:hypothetical protein